MTSRVSSEPTHLVDRSSLLGSCAGPIDCQWCAKALSEVGWCWVGPSGNFNGASTNFLISWMNALQDLWLNVALVVTVTRLPTQETQNHRLAKRFSQTLRNAGASGHAVWAVTRILSSSFVPSSAKWIMLQFSILRDIYWMSSRATVAKYMMADTYIVHGQHWLYWSQPTSLFFCALQPQHASRVSILLIQNYIFINLWYCSFYFTPGNSRYGKS